MRAYSEGFRNKMVETIERGASEARTILPSVVSLSPVERYGGSACQRECSTFEDGIRAPSDADKSAIAMDYSTD